MSGYCKDCGNTMCVCMSNKELIIECGATFVDIESYSELEKENARLREALRFYASRTVYEKLSQFDGDDQLSECGDIAGQALAKHSPENLPEDAQNTPVNLPHDE